MAVIPGYFPRELFPTPPLSTHPPPLPPPPSPPCISVGPRPMRRVSTNSKVINFILNIQPYVTESPNKSCNVVKRNQRIINRVACFKKIIVKSVRKVYNFNEQFGKK